MAFVPTLLLTNACHILNKKDELYAVIENNDIDVTIITESWLTSDTPTSNVSVGLHTTTFRKDRTSRAGGGVVAFVKNYLPNKHLTNLEIEDKEVLWLLLSPKRFPRPYSCIIVVGVYFPPGKPIFERTEMVDYLTDSLDTALLSYPNAGIIVDGDFNKMEINPLCRRFNLRKCVRSPTRGGNILDQILTNMCNVFNNVQHLPALCNSDHQCLLIKSKERPKIPATSKKIRVINAGNMVALTLKLNQVSWENLFDATLIDDKVDVFIKTLTNILDTIMPMKTIRTHPSDKAWITPKIKFTIKERQRSYTKANN